VEYINSLILLEGGAKKSAFTRLNGTKHCMSYQSTLDKASQIAENEDKKIKEWQEVIFDEHKRESELLREIECLEEKSDVGSVLSKARLQDELECLRYGMHPGMYFVGDNVDMRVHVRHHRLDHKDNDVHMFQMAAYKNRVPGNHLDPRHAQADITRAPFSLVVPSENEHELMRNNIANHVALNWIKYLLPFKGIEQPSHADHQYTKETTRKTERISLGILEKCENKNDIFSKIAKSSKTQITIFDN
jgi:hypothetical protein